MKKYLIVIALAITRLACTKEEVSNDDVISVSGNGNINGEVKEIRQLPGQPLSSTTVATNGHQDINADGAPDSLMGPHLPNNFLKPIE